MISAETIRTVVGIIGNAIALGLFLSPAPTFYRIWKKRAVEQFSAAPYLAGVLSCMVWILYALPMVHPHSPLVITVNGTGLVIEGAYVVLFLLFSGGAKRFRVLSALLVEIAFVGAVAVLVLTLAHSHERRSFIVGVLGAAFGTLMYAAPLSVMKMVIQTKSVEYMPFYLSLASFLCALCWTAYALIRLDPFITVPNGFGIISGSTQLVLHLLYYKSTKKQREELRKIEGDGEIDKISKNGGHCHEKMQSHVLLEEA